ncbi:MAG TPA: hypothetical protein VKV26_11155 [Dehalococcoidia bacterium]|nr:hypothetical protein [Dehalococcoidia bacterium]
MVTKAELHEAIEQLLEPALPAFLRDSPLADPEPDELEAIAGLDRGEPRISNEELARALGR